jgi:GNAT superfamily N-acetyltransferase
MAAYFDDQHHPRQALLPRVGFVALHDGAVIGYIGGHQTERHGCDGELQYLFVTPTHRRHGVGTLLLGQVAKWFHANGARKICVGIADDSPPEARPFVEHRGAVPLRKHWYAWEDIGADHLGIAVR